MIWWIVLERKENFENLSGGLQFSDSLFKIKRNFIALFMMWSENALSFWSFFKALSFRKFIMKRVIWKFVRRFTIFLFFFLFYLTWKKNHFKYHRGSEIFSDLKKTLIWKKKKTFMMFLKWTSVMFRKTLSFYTK